MSNKKPQTTSQKPVSTNASPLPMVDAFKSVRV